MSDWNSAQYMKYAKERTQPSVDLVARLSDINPKNVLDIGCGPGNSTHALKVRFADADILGIDASPDMLERARATYPDMKFKQCFVPQGFAEIDENFDLIFSNACIHWIPNQKELLTATVDKLNRGGTLAVQIPYIQEAPFYKVLFKMVECEKWHKLSTIKNFHNLTPEEYYDVLSELELDFDIWKTDYFHTVDGIDGVINWYKGSGLRPYLDALDENKQAEFLTELKENIKNQYSFRENGKMILKMPRIFFTATNK